MTAQGIYMTRPMTERVCKTDRHSTFYYEAGPADGIPIIFVHGWPELAISWRNQLSTFAEMGFRAIAPDLRGFGRSTVHFSMEAYTVEETVADLLELLSDLGCEKAVWVGHDFGAAVVWGLASHHPGACIAVSTLSVPYLPAGFTLETVTQLVNRETYPADEYPNGQWGYWAYNVAYPEDAARALDSDVPAAVRMIFGRGLPEMLGKPTPGGAMKAPAGWWPLVEFGAKKEIDTQVFSQADYTAYVAALKVTGFTPGLNFYRNNGAHAAYAANAVNGGRLDMPVLFIHAHYDPSCCTMTSALPEPMRLACSNLQERVVSAGHWVQQEDGPGVNACLLQWLATRVPDAWGSAAGSLL